MPWYWKISTLHGTWDLIVKPCIRGPILLKNVTRNYRGSLHSWWLLANKWNQEKQANINSHQKTEGMGGPWPKKFSKSKAREEGTEINFVKLFEFLTSTLQIKFKPQRPFYIMSWALTLSFWMFLTNIIHDPLIFTALYWIPYENSGIFKLSYCRGKGQLQTGWASQNQTTRALKMSWGPDTPILYSMTYTSGDILQEEGKMWEAIGIS